MARMRRLWANLCGGWFQLSRRFPRALLDEMAAAIATGERTHLGEIRFAVESRLAPLAVLEGLDAAARARQVFAQLRVWDTELNSGVLLYVLMAEHRIEIVADRGIAAKVSTHEWANLCARMRESYAAGQWRTGSLDGIAAANALLERHFPGDGKANPDELPDRPVLL
ncbi:TPM domain-containing protein [Rhodanobacter thiooxydans]|uniref:TPM domain-containing protein n=1 Tax=Rhodanobacter thiooxydans TaxID=416169 RepID=UPI000D355C06|nr:TPM domain-containing protein [Rhodanobacter thiooxydans]